MRVDFSSTKEFEPVPSGAYNVELKRFEEKTGVKGPYLQWELIIVNHDLYEGRKLRLTTSFSEGALGILRQFLYACEVIDDPKSLDAIDFEPIDLVGKIITVKVAQKSFTPEGEEARMVNEVKGTMRAA